MKTEWGLIVITRDGKTLLPEYEICSSREQAEERARQERSFGMTVIVAFRQVAEWEPVEAAAPETEGPAQTLLDAGVVPFADETGHGFEIDLTTAQPAAEGAREDDGLATLAAFLIDVRDRDYPASVYKFTPDKMAADLLASDWLAEDRRRARAEGGAEALEAAAEEMPSHVTTSSDERPINCVADARAWLRDRAAGLRETGGKGQTPRQALLAAAARLTDMGISARAAELLTEWAHE